MKSKLIILLPICLILLSSGCCKDKIVVAPVQTIDCPAPARPVLKQVKEYDPKVFFLNFSDITEYALVMERTVRCYKDALSPAKAEPIK